MEIDYDSIQYIILLLYMYSMCTHIHMLQLVET